MICGKKIFTTREEAITAISSFQGLAGKKKKSKNQPRATYFCKECNGWHITSQGAKKPKTETHTFEARTRQEQDKKSHGSKYLHIKNYSSTPIKIK